MPRLTPVFAFTTVVAGVLAFQFWQQLRAERERTAELNERVMQLELARPSVGAQAQSLPPVDAPLAAALGSPSGEPGVSVASGPAAAGGAQAARGSPAVLNLAELMNDPAFREAQREQLRAALPQNYPGLAEELGLTAQEAAALFDLLSKHQTTMLGNMAPAGPADESAVRAMQAAAQEMRRSQEAELAELLGSSRYEQWKEYQQTLPSRQRVERLRAVLASGESPLREDQAKSLVTVLASEQKRRAEQAGNVAARPAVTDPRAAMELEEENLRRTEESNRRVLENARYHLDGAQVAVLDRMLQQELTMSRAFQGARRTQMESGGQPADMVAAPVVVTQGWLMSP